MSEAPGTSTAFFCQLFGHEWVPRLQLGLECTRCGLFASEDGRVWPTRRAYYEEVVRKLPAMREAFVRARVEDHVFPVTPGALLASVRHWFEAHGFEVIAPQASEPAWLLKSKRRAEGATEVQLVARTSPVEGEGARLRVQRHTLTPGFVTRFDSVRALDVELALAQDVDAPAVQDYWHQAAEVLLPPPGWPAEP